MEPRSKQLTERQKADLLLSLVQGKVTLAEVCRKHGLEAREVEEWVKSVLGPDGKLPLPPPPNPRTAASPGEGASASGPSHPGAPATSEPGSSVGVDLNRTAAGEPWRDRAATGAGEHSLTSDEPFSPDADRSDGRVRVRRQRHRRRRVQHSASAAKTSRVVADWIWALSPILIGLGIGFAVLFLIWLGYFEPAPPPQ